MIGRFVSLLRGQWFKTTYGKWDFSTDGADLGVGAVIRDDESYVVLDDIVKRRLDLPVVTLVRLTYRLPEIVPGVFENNGVPQDITCDHDVAVFMMQKYSYPALVMCVTFGSEAVATYDFMQRKPFTVGRYTYLTEEQDPYEAHASLSAYNALITAPTLHAAQSLLDNIFTEAKMVVMHRVHLEMLYSNPIQQAILPPQDPNTRSMTQIIIIDADDFDMDIDGPEAENDGGAFLDSQEPNALDEADEHLPLTQPPPPDVAVGVTGETLNLLDPHLVAQRGDTIGGDPEASMIFWDNLLAETSLRDAAENYNEGVTPKVLELLTENFEISTNFEVRLIDDYEFEVCDADGVSFHVDLFAKTCSCFKYQMLLIPCPHAVVAAISIDEGMQNLIGEVYSASNWQNAYATAINHVVDLDGIMSITDGLNGLTLYPPTTRRPPGRPRKTRYLSRGETLRKRMKKERMCNRCKKQGHNRATCKMPLN